jgi:hypothetical protein
VPEKARGFLISGQGEAIGMATYKTVNRLSATDAAYIAGMIDGEGTITLTREHKNEHRRLVISIASTEKCLLEHIQGCIGTGKITNKRTYNPDHTPSFSYKITNRQALSLLEQVVPFLKGAVSMTKRKKCSMMLPEIESIRCK